MEVGLGTFILLVLKSCKLYSETEISLIWRKRPLILNTLPSWKKHALIQCTIIAYYLQLQGHVMWYNAVASQSQDFSTHSRINKPRVHMMYMVSTITGVSGDD